MSASRNVRPRLAEPPSPPCPLVGPLAERVNYAFGSETTPSRDAVLAAFQHCLAQPGAQLNELIEVYDKFNQWLVARERASNERRVRAEVERARAEQAAAEAERDRLRAERDQARADRQAAQRRQRAPFLSELSDQELWQFVDEVCNVLQANVHKIIKECNGLLPHTVKELVRLVVMSHAKQGYPAAARLIDRRVKKLMAAIVNGDFQRGKSTVESLIGQINFAINESSTVGDKCCTILVTVQRAWALALEATCKSKSVRNNDDPDHTNSPSPGAQPDSDIDEADLEDEDGGIDAADLGTMPIARMKGRTGREEVRNCLRAGGMAVAFRTESQYEAHVKIIAEINDSRGADEKAFVYTLVLDEADKFFGDGRAAHAKQLETMLGLRGSNHSNLPVLMLAVSATNIGVSYYLMRRMHKLRDNNLPCVELIDQVSFKPPVDGTYRSATASFLSEGEVVEVPRPDSDYSTEQIVRMVGDVMNRPHSMLVDTSCTRVNVTVEHNMIDHVDAVISNMPADRQKPMAVTHLHGGHSTHHGTMAVQMVCEDGLDAEDRGLLKLIDAHEQLADEEDRHADELQAAGADSRLIADARKMACVLTDAGENLEVNECTGCIEAHNLTELAWGVRRKANRLGFYKDAQILGLDDPPGSFNRDDGIGRSPWQPKHLPLLLFIIRKFIREDIPIAVVGNAMIKRSMSIVAVDVFRAPISVEVDGEQLGSCVGQPKCMALITDQIHTRCANAPDGAQMKARNCSTLTNFDVAHPDLFEYRDGKACVREIVVEDLSEAISGHVAYNAMDTWKAPMDQRMKTMKEIRIATRADRRARTIDEFRENVLDTEHKREMFDGMVEQVRSAGDVGDAISDVEHMLALACAMAQQITLPASVTTLIQRHRNPLFQSRAGEPERDLANMHANLCNIVGDRQPLAFRHALTKRRGGGRRGGGGGQLGGVAQMCLQHLANNNIREDADGNPPDDPPEAWTILWAIRDAHRQLIGQPGYSELSPTTNRGCGCGLALNKLFAAGQIKKGKYRRSKPDPEPGLGVNIDTRPREITCFWLARGVAVPTATPAAAVPVANLAGVANTNNNA